MPISSSSFVAAAATPVSDMDVDTTGPMYDSTLSFIDRVPAEVLIHILQKLGPRDVFHFALTSTQNWDIATNAQLWRHLSNSFADSLPPSLAPSLSHTLTRPSQRPRGQSEQVSRKGKEKVKDTASSSASEDEWTSWASLALARDNAARQIAFYSIKEPSQILLSNYGETLATLLGMIESRNGNLPTNRTNTVINFEEELFPSSVLGRHRFRWWIFPRELSTQPLLKEHEQSTFAAKSRKRQRVSDSDPSLASGTEESVHLSAYSASGSAASVLPTQTIADRTASFSTQQLAAELHCLHGPLYSHQRDIMEAAFWQQLCDPRDPHAPPLKPKSPLLRLLNEQARGTARPCSAIERVAAQTKVYDSGNYGAANQWGPLRAWIAPPPAPPAEPGAGATATSTTPAAPPAIVVPGINAPVDYAIVQLNTLQGAALAASVMDHLEQNGAAPEVAEEPMPPASSSPPPTQADHVIVLDELPVGTGSASATHQPFGQEGDDGEEEEEDPDFVPPEDWENESEDGGSDTSFTAHLELAMSEASSRRSVLVNSRLAERQGAKPNNQLLVKEIDWELVEAIMLCMHINIEDAKQLRGWGFHLPTALFETESAAVSGSGSRAVGGIVTVEQQRRQEADALVNMDTDVPLTRRRRRSLMETSPDKWFDPLRIPVGWDKSHGPDPRLEPGANPRDWAGVEGVWIGTYAFQDFPVFCAFQTALTRGRSFTSDFDQNDVVGDCLQLCLRVLPEGEMLPEADEEICAQPSPEAGCGVELLPDGGKDSVERLPPLRIKGHAVQYTHSGEEVRRSSIYGMVRPVYGYVASTLDAGKTSTGKDASSLSAAGAAMDDTSTPIGSRKLVIKGFHWNLCHRYLNANSWSLSGIQPGGLGSRLPILGIWTDADRMAAQPSPCGPWLYYRIGNRRWEDVRNELRAQA